MRHEAEDSSRRITQPGDVGGGTVGIPGVTLVGGMRFRTANGSVRVCRWPRGVFEGNLASLAPLVDDRVVPHNDPAFRMSDWQVDLVDAAQEDVIRRGDSAMNPARGVLAVVVPGQCGICRSLLLGIVPTASPHWQDAGFEQSLKPVADAENQFVRREKLLNRVSEMSSQLAGEDDTRSDVVTITEPAGDTENLVLVEQLGLFDQPEEVDASGMASTQIKGVRGLPIAVRTGRA